MKHEVWDVDIGKCFGAFETLDDALTYVRALLSTNGDDYVQYLVVTTIGDEWGDQNLTGDTLLAEASYFEQPSN